MSILTNNIVKRSDYTSEVMNLIDQLFSKFFPNGQTAIASRISNTKTQLAKSQCSELVPNQTCQILSDMYVNSANIQNVPGAQDPRTLGFHFDDKVGFNFYGVILSASEMADIKGLAATYLTGTAPCTLYCAADSCSSDGCSSDGCSSDGCSSDCPGDTVPCDPDEPDCQGYTCSTFDYDVPDDPYHFWCSEFSCSNVFHIYSSDNPGECTIFDLPSGCNGTYEWITSGPCAAFCG